MVVCLTESVSVCFAWLNHSISLLPQKRCWVATVPICRTRFLKAKRITRLQGYKTATEWKWAPACEHVIDELMILTECDLCPATQHRSATWTPACWASWHSRTLLKMSAVRSRFTDRSLMLHSWVKAALRQNHSFYPQVLSWTPNV